MQLLVLVLNKVDSLEDILKGFIKAEIKGATILDSVGMARVLTHDNTDDLPLFGSLRMVLNENRPFNKTIFVVLKEEKVPDAIKAIKDVLGDLSKPDLGVLFTIPLSYTEGICS
jgi:predicted transcriptional regulator